MKMTIMLLLMHNSLTGTDGTTPPRTNTPELTKSNGILKEISFMIGIRNVYLDSVITDESSKPEILYRIVQTTAALTRLKPVWNNRSICDGIPDSFAVVFINFVGLSSTSCTYQFFLFNVSIFLVCFL